jgi:hypothetical protein
MASLTMAKWDPGGVVGYAVAVRARPSGGRERAERRGGVDAFDGGRRVHVGQGAGEGCSGGV